VSSIPCCELANAKAAKLLVLNSGLAVGSTSVPQECCWRVKLELQF